MKSNENNLKQYESWTTLKNGGEVFIRPIMQTDGPLIVDLFNKLSPRSKYLRFLRNLSAFPEDMLYRFTHVNYISEFALVAVIKENGKESIIGVARYTCPTLDDRAELGLTIRDDWQNIGLGKSLLKEITDIGKKCGVYRFGVLIEPQNNAIKKIIRELDYNVHYSPKNGAYQVELTDRQFPVKKD